MTLAARNLSARNLMVRLGSVQVLNDVSLSVPDGKVTAIIGPNGCGKSTLLRSLAGLIRPDSGAVALEGQPTALMRRSALARKLTLLPQAPLTPEGMRVRELVMRGRTPWLRPFLPPGAQDRHVVARAMDATGVSALAGRELAQLSGGQRQRAWLAMALAQDTGWLLLDEPTTWLDLPHQLDILGLARSLNRDLGRSVVMVLHDISLAARFADHIVAMRQGQIMAEGEPAAVITPTVLMRIFDLRAQVIPDPLHGSPLVLPE